MASVIPPPKLAAGEQSISLKALGTIAANAAGAWTRHNASSKGAALALYTLLSLAPVLLLVTVVGGWFFSAHTVSQDLVEDVRTLVGDQGAQVVLTVLGSGGSHKQSETALAAAISFIVVLISSTTAFAELKTSLDELWELPPATGNGVWVVVRERILSFGIVLVLALLVVLSLAASALLSALEVLWGNHWAQSVAAEAAVIASEVISFAVIVGLFAAIYKVLPNTLIAWRDVLPGALFTAALFMIGKGLIGFYLGHGGVTTSYGAAGSFIALMLWVYYSSLIFFYGALLTHEWTFVAGSRRGQPRRRAELIYRDVADPPQP